MKAFLRTTLALTVCTRLVLFAGDVQVIAAAPDFVVEPAPITASALPVADFLRLTNQSRMEIGQAPLVLNEELTAAAQAKAADMVAKHYFAHFHNGERPWDYIEDAGYHYSVAGENLARGYRTVEGITEAWLASPTHAANLLSSKYTEVGFACVRTVDESGQPQLITVQMFGAR